MVPTTAEWHSAVLAQFRYQAYIKCTLRLVPPGVHEGMSVTGNYTDKHANIDVLEDRDEKNIPHKYATLEPYRWKLDGTWDVLSPNTVADDYWTKPLQGMSAFVYFEFDQPYDLPGIYFDWDRNSNTWPSKIILHGYNNSHTEIYTFVVTDINSPTGFLNLPMDGVRYVTLEIVSWSRAEWRARINEVIFGVNLEYDSINNGKINSVTQTDSTEPLMSKLPTHTMSMVLRNLDQELDPLLTTGVSKYLAERQRIRYQWGFNVDGTNVEWLGKQNYYIQGFKVPSDSKEVTIDSCSRLDFLVNEFREDEYQFGTTRSFEAIALEVLNASGIIKDYDGETPWVLATKLSNMFTAAPVKRMAHNAILQLIASATGTYLHTDTLSGYVRIDEFGTQNNVHEIGLMQSIGDPQIDLQQSIKSIAIAVYKYIRSDDTVEIARGTYELSGTTVLTVVYNTEAAVGVSATVTGGTLVSAKYYGAAAVLKISGSGSCEVVIKGREVKGQPTFITTYEDPSVANGVAIVLDNFLVTETTYLAQLTAWLKQWYQKRQKYNISYTGYPELVAGDPIHLTTVYGEQDVTITKNTIQFNGGWSGTAEAL